LYSPLAQLAFWNAAMAYEAFADSKGWDTQSSEMHMQRKGVEAVPISLRGGLIIYADVADCREELLGCFIHGTLLPRDS
jgi:hypothetical protein